MRNTNGTLKYTIKTTVVDGDTNLEIRDITASSSELLRRDVMIRNLMRAACALIRSTGEDDGFSEADLMRMAKDELDESFVTQYQKQYRIPT